MKQNVDLTRTRDFSRMDRGLFRSNDIDILGDVGKFAQTPNAQMTFATGDSEIRAIKRYESGFAESNGVCDCCGSDNPLKLLGDSICIDCWYNFHGYTDMSIWWRTRTDASSEMFRWFESINI